MRQPSSRCRTLRGRLAMLAVLSAVLALLAAIGAATAASGSHPLASTSSLSDTLSNGIPRAFARKLVVWVEIWRHVDPSFTLGKLESQGTGTFTFIYGWASLARGDAHDIGDRALDTWAPDSAHWVNFDMYRSIERNDDGTLALSGDVDSAPVFADIKSDSLWLVAQCGTPCWYDGTYWMDAAHFALTGITSTGSQQDGAKQAFLDVYDLISRRAARWVGPAVTDDLLDRYQAANDSVLLARRR